MARHAIAAAALFALAACGAAAPRIELIPATEARPAAQSVRATRLVSASDLSELVNAGAIVVGVLRVECASRWQQEAAERAARGGGTHLLELAVSRDQTMAEIERTPVESRIAMGGEPPPGQTVLPMTIAGEHEVATFEVFRVPSSRWAALPARLRP